MQEITSLGCDDKASSFQSSIAHFLLLVAESEHCQRILPPAPSLHTHARTHARMHARTQTHTYTHMHARAGGDTRHELSLPLPLSLFLRFESKSKMTHIAIGFNSDQSGVDIVVLSAGRPSPYPLGSRSW